MRMIFLATLAASIAAGCSGSGDGPQTMRVRGEVTYNGEPLEDGTIDFVSTDGSPPAQGLIAAYARTIFLQPDGPSAHAQLGEVVEQLRSRFPKAAEVLLRAEEDVLAYTAVPREHWSKVWSTNPLERLNRELARRTDVVGIFPNRDALVRLAGALLAEQHDEWLTAERRYLPEGSLTRLLGGVVNPTLGELLKEGAAV